MIRLAGALGLLLGGFIAGLAAGLVVLDRVLGGRGPTLGPAQRRALDAPLLFLDQATFLTLRALLPPPYAADPAVSRETRGGP